MNARRLILAALLLAAPAFAQDPNYNTDRTSAPLPPTVSFRNAPVWVKVPGTNVSIVGQDQRPTYDMFAFDNQYYIYNEGYWYRSDLLNGPYVALELNALPPEFRTVPRASWISYPAGWDVSTPTPGATATTTTWAPTVEFSTVPHWQTVPGSSRVYYIRQGERPKYDLFQYNGHYYTYQRGNWYMAPTLTGTYGVVEANDVPSAFRTVRERYWVSYPSGWSYQLPSTVKVKVKTEK